MARPTVDKFLDLARRSRLIDHDRLDRAIEQLKTHTDGDLNDSRQMADWLVERGLLTRWQCHKLMEGRHRGFFLGKYRLLDLLGTGGMSSVYLAEHVLMQRRVAIKVLPRKRVDNTSYLGRFHREAQAAASLDHRNIVRAYDVDNEGDIHYMVMEYVEGRDLRTMVEQQGPLDYPAAVDYIRQAAEGLAHAHDAGLVHRDVKPANLLVDGKNVVKVLDLGLARFSDETMASLTVAYEENVLGTADYLAPEQAIDSHAVDARADIYSLGCSLYFVLTGHPPFPDGTLPQRLIAHQKHAPPPIRRDRPDVDDDLIAICDRMMAKKKQDRYDSMHHVAEALAQWLVDHGFRLNEGSDVHGDGGASSSTRRRAAAAGRTASDSSGQVSTPPDRQPIAEPPRLEEPSRAPKPKPGAATDARPRGPQESAPASEEPRGGPATTTRSEASATAKVEPQGGDSSRRRPPRRRPPRRGSHDGVRSPSASGSTKVIHRGPPPRRGPPRRADDDSEATGSSSNVDLVPKPPRAARLPSSSAPAADAVSSGRTSGAAGSPQAAGMPPDMSLGPPIHRRRRSVPAWAWIVLGLGVAAAAGLVVVLVTVVSGG